MKDTVIFCDFDGTICIPDSSEFLLERFGTPRWMELEQEVWQGKITEHDAFPLQLRTMKVDWPEARLALLEGVRIREGFVEFVSWCREQNLPFIILSSGLRILIDELLATVGIADVAIHSQDVRIVDGRWEFVPYRGERYASHCSLCKCVCLEAQKQRGKRIVYIGDGYTDICPSERADILFATGDLSRTICTNDSRPFFTYETFYDIERQLASLIQADQEINS